jgi:hypothetical protein
MTKRKELVDEAIARGDVDELLSLVESGPCACLGAGNGEPLCRCRMNAQQVLHAVAYAALKRGKLVRLTP